MPAIAQDTRPNPAGSGMPDFQFGIGGGLAGSPVPRNGAGAQFGSYAFATAQASRPQASESTMAAP